MPADDAQSLDQLIADYLQRIDDGDKVDPEEFISSWPRCRQEFLQFVEQANILEDLVVRPNVVPANWPSDTGLEADRGMPQPSHSRSFLNAPDGYEITSLLGRGGMGTVYAAKRTSDNARVALKILNHCSLTNPAWGQRCLREARIVSSFVHDHVVPLYDVVQNAGAPVLVMKLIDGVTLSDLVHSVRFQTDVNGKTTLALTPVQAAGGLTEAQTFPDVPQSSTPSPGYSSSGTSASTPLTGSSVMDCLVRAQGLKDYDSTICLLIADVAMALSKAHSSGIVHRDIKSSNILLDASGKVWLTDFGLASLGEDQSTLTATGDLLGTPVYMSPEQARGETRLIDHRSDIYSLGATLYELATLQRPFNGQRQQIISNVLQGNLNLPSQQRPDISPLLEAIILKAMSFRPVGRYQSAAEFAEDLKRFAAGGMVRARKRGISDRILRWAGCYPRLVVGSIISIVSLFVSIFVIQVVVSNRLADLNDNQLRTNIKLTQANEELVQANLNLTTSQNALRHHLYVSDMSAAFRAFALGDVDTTRQLLERQAAGLPLTKPMPFEWRLLNTLAEPVQVHELSVHTADAREVASIPGTRQFLSVYTDGMVIRHDSESQRELSRFKIDGSLDAVAVPPDGNSFLVGQNVVDGLNPVTLRDLRTGEVIREFTGHEYSVESAAFSPDGQLVATAGRYQDVLLHSIDGTLLHRINTLSRNESLAFTADGQYLLTCVREEDSAAAEGKTQAVHAWRLTDMQKAFELSPDFMVYTFAANQSLDSAARVFVAGAAQVALFDTSSQTMIGASETLRGGIRCVALSDDGSQAAAGCDNGLLYYWNLADQWSENVAHSVNRRRPTVIDTGRGGITSLEFSATQQLLMTKGNGSVQFLELPTPHHNGSDLSNIQFAVQSPINPNRVFARFHDGTIVRFDEFVDEDQQDSAENPGRCRLAEPVVLMQAPVDFHGCLAVSHDEQFLVAAGAKELIVVSTASGEVLARSPLPVQDKQIRGLSFSRDHSTLFVLLSDRVIAYSATDWKMWKEQILPNESAVRLVTSPTEDSLLVITATELIQLPSGLNTILRRQTTTQPSCANAEFSPSGRLLVVGFGDGTLEVRNAETWDIIAPLRGHRGSPWSIRFLQQEQTLLTAGADGVIRFWDLETWRELGVLFGDSQEVITFEEQDAIATFGGHAPVKIFSVPPLPPDGTIKP